MLGSGTLRVGRASRMVWPLILVLGLVLFVGVDFDGDVTTSNGPPVVVTTGAEPRQCEQVAPECSGPGEAAVSWIGKRLWRRAGRWRRRVPFLLYRRILPIRGP